MRRPVLLASAIALSSVAALAGCGSSSSGGSATSPAASSATPSLSGSITVFAAASLTDSFGTIGKQFEAAHPGTTVTFSFGASSTLATQISQGAPADVFASASTKNMDQVAGQAGTPSTFAKNVMEVAVPPSNPANVSSINDLAKSSVKVAVCEPAVPCGTLANQIFKNAGITVKPVTQEADVKATLSKVELGEVDAGMVYVTDVKSAGDKVAGVQIPDNVNAATDYPIATITASKNPALAQAFMDYVLSPDGQAVLTEAGFQQP